jgi:hypothetical protein
MKRTKLPLALASLVIPSCAIPGGTYIVINNTAGTMTCSVMAPGTPWGPWLKLRRASNLRVPRSADLLYVQCRPPVRQVRFTLHPGMRYSLLPAPDGQVDLVEVALPAPEQP